MTHPDIENITALAYQKKIDILDDEFSDLVRQKGRCEKCGTTNNLQCAHIYAKGDHPALRYDILNVLCLCTRCHMFWGHRNPADFIEWVQTHFPERWAYLQMVKELTVKRIPADYQEILLCIRHRHLWGLVVPMTKIFPALTDDLTGEHNVL